jgi:flagellar hook-associated protein 2
MDSLVSISGLATGIDFRSLVDQIVRVESRRLDHLRARIARSQSERNAWGEVRARLVTLREKAAALGDGSAFDAFVTSMLGSNTSVLAASASKSASPGRHTVRVLQTAQREILASDLFASRSAALGLSGAFSVGGKIVAVNAEDSLEDLAARINGLDGAARASVIRAGGAYRLVISASETGAAGARLVDFSDVLVRLGFTDVASVLQHRTGGGFQSSLFDSASTTIGALLGFSDGAPSGVVTFGEGANAFTVALDLGRLTLAGVRDAINSAAASAGAATFAEVVYDTSQGTTKYRLRVTGEAAVTDDGAVLRALGVLAGGRAAVSQVVASAPLRVDAQGTPATASSPLASLYNGGSHAGVAANDTITFRGTRHDGTEFSFVHTIQAGDTIATLLGRLQSSEGFGDSAIVNIDSAGRITVTSSTAGASSLRLEAFAGNESGAILDLGPFGVTVVGRERVISAGADALVEIDGTRISSASNEISDAVSGITFSVLAADPTTSVDVVVARDAQAGVTAVRAFMEAYNALAEYVGRGAGTVGSSRPPLAGDSILRAIQDRIASVLQAGAEPGLQNSIRRLGDIGLEVTRTGTYRLDETKLLALLQREAGGVRRLFAGFGVTDTASLAYLGAGMATKPGTYAVTVAQPGTRAVARTVGFGGVYVDDGDADRLSITDIASGATYEIALANGMSLAQIVSAINGELTRRQSHEIASERILYADAGASTAATGTTPLSSLYHGPAQGAGFVAGTEISIAGTRPDGTTVFRTFEVTDPDVQTLGHLRAAVQAAFGSGVSVMISNGQLVARDIGGGQSSLVMSIGSDVPGNTLPFGQMLVAVAGRDAAPIVAEAAGSELRIRHEHAGAAQGFAIAFIAGGSSGASSLGLDPGNYVGTDVVGSIGGEAATGAGDVLTADANTAAAGLSVRVFTAASGAVGTVTYARGLASSLEGVLAELLRTGDGALDGLVRRLDEAGRNAEARLRDRESRLEARRQALLARFVALEKAMARAQSMQQWMSAQLGSLSQTPT